MARSMIRFLAGAAASMLLAMSPADAQTKIQVGCTATSDCASAMIAVDEGLFKKQGLDVEMVLIGINSNIPAAILSGSIQIGGPTSTVFLQAADGGLDLVAVAGATRMSPPTNGKPLDLVKASPPNQPDPVLKPEQLAWWIDIMASQKMLQSKLDLDRLILK